MLSFRSLFLAAAAFATLASAIPTASGPLDIAEGLTNGGGLSNIAPLAGGAAPGIPNLAGGGLPAKRGGEKAPAGDYIRSCHDQIEPIVIKIEAAVKVEGGLEIVVGLLGEIVIILRETLAKLKLIAVIELTLGGVICTIRELAVVIATLLILVIKVVWLVVFVLGYVDVALCDVIGVIGGLLCEILQVLFFLLIDLKVEIAILLGSYGRDCGFVHYDAILVLLGIKI